MAAALAEVLAVLRRKRGADYRAAHDAVQRWLDDFGEERLAERVIDEAPADAPVEELADLFGYLVWATSDNGSQVNRTLERWLPRRHRRASDAHRPAPGRRGLSFHRCTGNGARALAHRE